MTDKKNTYIYTSSKPPVFLVEYNYFSVQRFKKTCVFSNHWKIPCDFLKSQENNNIIQESATVINRMAGERSMDFMQVKSL